MRPRFEDAEIDVAVVKDAPSAAVRRDPARRGIVRSNVLADALKSSARDEWVTIRVSRRQNAPPGKLAAVQIAVTDTRSGAPAEFRERAFEQFIRVEHQGTNGPKGVRGTGIGLCPCRQPVEAHGGSIRCEAGDNDRGMRLAIQLPAQG